MYIVLSRQLASLNHFPAIDILNSVSRVMMIWFSKNIYLTRKLKKLLATYYEAKDLIDVGAYVRAVMPKLISN